MEQGTLGAQTFWQLCSLRLRRNSRAARVAGKRDARLDRGCWGSPISRRRPVLRGVGEGCKMTFPCRCYNRIKGKVCFTRKSLRMRPEQYADAWRQPKCPSCGARKWHVDKYRVRKEMGWKPMCNCGGYHFYHRKGSKFCYHHPNAEQHHVERYEHHEQQR